jgi:nucleoside-diphosphate-sugar epimerase
MSNSNGKLNGKPQSTSPMPPLEQVLRKRTILITGATGFLGKVFLMLLLKWRLSVDSRRQKILPQPLPPRDSGFPGDGSAARAAWRALRQIH